MWRDIGLQQIREGLRAGIERRAEGERTVQVIEREPLVAHEDRTVRRREPLAAQDGCDRWQAIARAGGRGRRDSRGRVYGDGMPQAVEATLGLFCWRG